MAASCASGIAWSVARGPTEITGGEGRLAGARGEGPIVIRRYAAALETDGDGHVEAMGLGIAYRRGFRFETTAE